MNVFKLMMMMNLILYYSCMRHENEKANYVSDSLASVNDNDDDKLIKVFS